MLKRFEKFLAPTQTPPDPQPPATLFGFYWHFAQQAKWLFAMLFVAGFVVALFDATIPVFMGRVVTRSPWRAKNSSGESESTR